MLSRTAEYAIRATLALAGLPQGTAKPASELASELGVPRNYLSKTLNRLAKRGVLVSVRGPGGGFRLARDAASIAVSEVVAEFDDLEPSGQCLMGGRACDQEHPCTAHERWKTWSESMARMMDSTTMADFMSTEDGVAGGEAA